MLVTLDSSKVAEGIADFRLNTQGPLLASAARTATVSSPQQINYNAKGVIVTLNVTTASGTGGLTARIIGIDPVTGNSIYLAATPTAITATGISVYELYPGISGAQGNVVQRQSAALLRTWRVDIIHGDATSYTYSVGYSLIL